MFRYQALIVLGVLTMGTMGKVDLGPCPATITQATWSASMSGKYYLQYVD